MATSENLIPIPGRLHSVATEKHVAGADEIYDDDLQKLQSTINDEVTGAIDNAAYLEDGDSSAIIPSFDPQADSLHKAAQILSAAEKAQVKSNLGLDGDLSGLQNSILAETSRAQGAESTLQSNISAEVSRAQAVEATKANASNVYSKSETYTKSEVNNLVDTPHQNYVTVATYASLPASGSADTIYRVSNYNGSTSQVDATMYSEYAWNGSAYVFLSVKSQVGEVFDISEYNASAKYADLAAALGTDGANVPESVRKGGMSIKFVQSSDNKYVQYRYMGTETTGTPNPLLNTANWQGVDEKPLTNSKNLIISGGVQKLADSLSKFLFNEIEATELLDYNLNSNGTFSTGATHKHACIPVKEGDVYIIQTTSSSNARYAFATSDSYSSGGSIPLVQGTTVVNIPELNNYNVIIIPNGCSYLLFNAGDYYGTTCYHVKNMKEINVLDNTVKRLLGINNTIEYTRENPYRQSDYTISSTSPSEYRKVEGVSQSYFYKVNKGDVIELTANENYAISYALLASTETSEPVDYIDSENNVHNNILAGKTKQIEIPEDCYLYILGNSRQGNDYFPTKIEALTSCVKSQLIDLLNGLVEYLNVQDKLIQFTQNNADEFAYKYISNQNEWVSSNYKSALFYKVKKGQKITITANSTQSYCVYAWLNNTSTSGSPAFMDGEVGRHTDITQGTTSTIVAPYDGYLYVLSLSSQGNDWFPSSIVIKQIVSERIDNIEKELQSITSRNNLTGKKVVFIGASVVSGFYASSTEKRYSSLFCAKYNANELNLGAASTCMASNGKQTDPSVAANRFVTRATSTNLSNAALIIVGDAGGNDFSYDSKAIGQSFIEETITPHDNVGDKKRSAVLDTDTYAGALHELINTIRTNAPVGCPIVFVNSSTIRGDWSNKNPTARECNANGDYLEDFDNTTEKICRYYGIPFLRVSDIDQLDFTNSAIAQTYSHDSLHPLDAGHARIAELLFRFVEEKVYIPE